MNISINICHKTIILVSSWSIHKIWYFEKFLNRGSTGKNQGVGRGVKHHNLTQPKLYQTLQKFNCILYICSKA